MLNKKNLITHSAILNTKKTAQLLLRCFFYIKLKDWYYSTS